MPLLSINDFEITNGKKLDLSSTYLRVGINRLKKKNLIQEDGCEKVIDPYELMLELYKIVQEKDKRCGNRNNPKGN